MNGGVYLAESRTAEGRQRQAETVEFPQYAGVAFAGLARGWAEGGRQALALASIAWITFHAAPDALAQMQPRKPVRQTPANELARKVVENEIQAHQTDRNSWMYRSRKEEPGNDEVRQVVRTKQGTLKVLISRNGQQLAPEQQQKEHERIQGLVSQPEEREKKQQETREDGERAKKLLLMLPEAFLFSYRGREQGLLALRFEPNPDFHPPSREAEVFHKMEGTMWINERQQRLAQLEGCLAEQVRFAGGFLGHLDKGGTFKLIQSEVSPTHWELSLIDVNIHGKAVLFKTIYLQHTESMFKFHRIPDTTTLYQAMQMLENEGAVGRHRAPKIAQPPTVGTSLARLRGPEPPR